jgi:phosphatidyl-myo-inositol dimannoside synthase
VSGSEFLPAVTRTLVVTNDFPPRLGGIQTFLYEALRRRPTGSVVVYTSRWRGSSAFDDAQDFRIVRDRRRVLLPTPAVARRAEELLVEYGCNSVLFGAAAPLGLLGPRLRAAGADRLIALTHGHEAGWAGMPGGSPLLRRIGDGVDLVTYLGDYTRARIAPALSPEAAGRMQQLAPGVDETAFSPAVDGSAVRSRYGLHDRPVVVCVSRLMARKGQDTLVRSLPAVRSRVPGAALLVVGDGPYRARLKRLADASGVRDHVIFTGSVPVADLPAHYAAGDVFAMPCRTRNRGLDVEGLGIVYLEAAATGLPVIAGDSGGAPDAVLDGVSGYVVASGANQTAEVADRLSELLLDPQRARALGQAGRAWVEDRWRWDGVAGRLGELLTAAPDLGRLGLR